MISKKMQTALIIVTVILGCGIIILSFVTNNKLQEALPAVPSLATGAGRTTDTVKAELANYKAFLEIIKEKESFLNELLGVKFMKGMFDTLIMAIVGLVFAKPLIEAAAARLKGNK